MAIATRTRRSRRGARRSLAFLIVLAFFALAAGSHPAADGPENHSHPASVSDPRGDQSTVVAAVAPNHVRDAARTEPTGTTHPADPRPDTRTASTATPEDTRTVLPSAHRSTVGSRAPPAPLA